jgi:hypothetical protein
MKMPADTKAFWRLYERTAAALFTPIGMDNGLAEKQVTAGERQVDFHLPLLLRQFYLRVGKRADLTRRYHRLLRPGELRVSAGALVFFEESQRVVFWGIPLADLGMADPPVWQANNHTKKRLAWYPDHDRLSDFWVTMLYRQFLEYSEHNGVVPINHKTLTAIRRDWPRVELHGKNIGEVEVFARDGQALCVFRQGHDLELLAAGRTEQAFLNIGQRLGIAEELCGVEASGDEES